LVACLEEIGVQLSGVVSSSVEQSNRVAARSPLKLLNILVFHDGIIDIKGLHDGRISEVLDHNIIWARRDFISRESTLLLFASEEHHYLFCCEILSQELSLSASDNWQLGFRYEPGVSVVVSINEVGVSVSSDIGQSDLLKKAFWAQLASVALVVGFLISLAQESLRDILIGQVGVQHEVAGDEHVVSD